MTEPYNAQSVLDKIDWEGPEGIEWFDADDAYDPEGSSDLYDAVNAARNGWAEFNRALRTIEKIAKDRNEVGDSDS